MDSSTLPETLNYLRYFLIQAREKAKGTGSVVITRVALDEILDNTEYLTPDCDLAMLTRDALQRVMEQREEILEAFVAKYGAEPDDTYQVEQETPSGRVWYVTTLRPETFRVPVVETNKKDAN